MILTHSSFAFVSNQVDPRIIGQKLRAKYVLEGRIKAADEGYTVAVGCPMR